MTIRLYKVIALIRILMKQLWLSLSSTNFYYDVYKYYSGYGLRYIFTISFISSVVYSLFVLNYFLDLKNYFTSGQITSSTKELEYVVSQLPNIDYDGKNISFDGEDPFFLYDSKGRKVVAIDPKNQLSYVDKAKIPFIFSSNQVVFASLQANSFSKKSSTTSLEYPKLFGNKPFILSSDSFKKNLSDIFKYIPSMFIYIGMPVMIAVRLFVILIEKSFSIVLVYFLTNIFGISTSVKTSIRLVLFSAGGEVLMQTIVHIFLPFFPTLVSIVKIWSSLLLLLGVLKVKKETL